MAGNVRPWYRIQRQQWYATVNSKQVPLGVSDPRDESGAWAALRSLVSQAVSEAIKPPNNFKPGTIAELVEPWLKVRTEANANTLKAYAKHLKWLCKLVGTKTVAEVDVPAIVMQSKAEGWSDSHRCNTLWCVMAFLRWCGRTETVVLPPKESRGPESLISEETHRRALYETRGDFRQLIAFLWLMGSRPGESTGLTFDLIDWENGTIRLKKHKTRHKGKVRILYLCAEATQILKDQAVKYKSAGLVFRGLRGRRFSLQSMTMRFQRLSENLGVQIRSYDYRHTWITRALTSGVPDTHVAAMAGTSAEMIRKHYNHIAQNARMLKEVVERIAQNGKAG
jgi:integrase